MFVLNVGKFALVHLLLDIIEHVIFQDGKLFVVPLMGFSNALVVTRRKTTISIWKIIMKFVLRRTKK